MKKQNLAFLEGGGEYYRYVNFVMGGVYFWPSEGGGVPLGEVWTGVYKKCQLPMKGKMNICNDPHDCGEDDSKF